MAGRVDDLLARYRPERVALVLGTSTSSIGATEEAYARLSDDGLRSEEHTSELQSLMRISYAVFCLKKKYKLLTLTTTSESTTYTIYLLIFHFIHNYL